MSYTRKDGQFLRWDPQSGRDVSKKLHKESVPSLNHALHRRLDEIAADIPTLKRRYGGSQPLFIEGSSLTELRKLPSCSFDAVVTSPPYANRYDYTRTYALELAYLGYDANQFKELRQALLSATVENRSKRELLLQEYGEQQLLSQALDMTDKQAALQEALGILKTNAKLLSNSNVISLVENYFTEMALIICELGRLIEAFSGELDFENHLEELAIAPEAWEYINDSGIDPKLVFAHQNMLRAHPQASLHYRGIATLSLKRVQAMASQVKSWEDGTYRRAPTLQRCQRVARVYNAVTSVIITGTDGWTLENGYRNVPRHYRHHRRRGIA